MHYSVLDVSCRLSFALFDITKKRKRLTNYFKAGQDLHSAMLNYYSVFLTLQYRFWLLAPVAETEVYLLRVIASDC